jgi:hypothetical protein
MGGAPAIRLFEIVRRMCSWVSPGAEELDGADSDDSAVGTQDLPVDPGSVGTGQEGDSGSDVLRLT